MNLKEDRDDGDSVILVGEEKEEEESDESHFRCSYFRKYY